MKSNYILLTLSIAALIFCLSPNIASARHEAEEIITINGTVKDKVSKKAIGYASVSLEKSDIGTVTNSDGQFSLKLRGFKNRIAINVSNLGYENSKKRIDIAQGTEIIDNLVIYLNPKENMLNEIIIYPNNPRSIVEKALEKIEVNYPNSPNLLTCFYREIVEKGRRCISISEAVIESYKTSYKKSIEQDKVRIVKGRKLLTPKPSDTLFVKLLGGPALVMNLDIAKNRNGILSYDELTKYDFRMEETAAINDRFQYVISFSPRINPIDLPLFYGKLYIDKESLSFTRVELSLSMDDPVKATRAMLYKKPSGLVFKPKESSFIVTYNYDNGISRLSYIRNTIKFKCDWKKRLFSTNYALVSEMVVTDRNQQTAEPFPSKTSFNDKDIFYDKLVYFTDPDFWKNYIIIEPTESLENIVDKLIQKIR